MHFYEKVPNKIGQGPPPPPLIWTKSKRTAIFPRETVPRILLVMVHTLLRTTTGAVSEDGRPLYSASPSSFVFLGIASGESPPILKD